MIVRDVSSSCTEARDVIGVTGNADVTTADVLPLMILMSTTMLMMAMTTCYLAMRMTLHQ